jgi:hypothetical protein
MDENRAHLAKVVTDKNIQRVVRTGTEMPPPIRGDAPLTNNPHGAPVPPSAAADTRAARELGPLTPSPALRPIPPGAKISPNVTAALPRQADGVEQRVHDFLKRKYK